MEAAGVALAVTSLVLELYNKCKNSSATFHQLGRDLKSFYQALVLTEHYLLYLDDIRVACEELAADIEEVLSKRTSRNIIKRVKATMEDIQPLRTRLAVQMSALQICASMLKECGLDPGIAGSARSSQSLSVVLHDMNKLWNDYYQQAQNHTVPDLSRMPLKAIVLGGNPSSSSTFDVSSDALSSLKFTESLVRTPSTQSFPNSNSSIVSTQKEPSSPLSHFESLLSQSRTSIVEAAIEDNTATMCNLLIAVSRNPEGLPVYAEQVKTLLLQGASFDCADSEYLRTPLIWAIIAGGRDLVELFLEEQALMETCDGIWDWTPVIWSVMEDKPDILNVLIEKGADLAFADSISNRTALLWAASVGNDRATKLLLDKNEELINVTDKEGMTPLALAYLGNHLETAQLLANARYKPSFKLKFEFSLAWAILAKDEDFARLLLLKHGFNAQSTDMDGVPVLVLAIKQNLPDIAELLVNKGADVQCTDKNNVPALTVAVKNQREDIAGMLVRNGAELEARDGDGNTALMWAVWSNDEGLVKMLIESKANVAAVDGEENKVQISAALIGNEKIIKLVSSTA